MIGKFIMILLIFGVAVGIELPGIIKKKQWKELAVFSGFLICGLTITIMHQVFKFEFFRINYWFIAVFGQK